jgi:SAM-dependent methyltransferase
MSRTLELTYNPAVFDVSDISGAMRIILTPEGVPTEQRWRVETPYVADLIAKCVAPTPQMLLVDYGCGIGRLAKELIARHRCRVIGVDISASMRALAVNYVQSERFFTCAPPMLDVLIDRGLTVDAAISIWVLQHCVFPSEDVTRLKRVLKAGGGLFILNNDDRAVPTVERGWVSDGLDIKALLSQEFVLQDEGRPVREQTSDSIAELTYWASFQKRE